MDIYCFCVHMYVCLSTQLVCVTNLLELNLGESTTLLIWLSFFFITFLFTAGIYKFYAKRFVGLNCSGWEGD
jgi:pilus assembly protein TadC